MTMLIALAGLLGFAANRPARAQELFGKGDGKSDAVSKIPSTVAELERLSEAYAKLSETVKPSVVHIRAISINPTMNRELQRMLGEENFRPVPTTGTGSGIVLDADGHIVTNNHVIADAKRISVALSDGRKFNARVVGTDPKTDIAVLKINSDRLQPAKLGDSDQLRAGQMVLAVGSPFRLGHSVSHGMISAIGRNEDAIDVDIPYKNWIQTDAPINPGNSGGPLINMRGEVIGLNVAIATESGANQGVGFAIPANTVKRISGMLRSGEKIVRGYLGVIIKPVDDRVADAYGLSDVAGAFIAGVAEDSPAATAGLHAEDIVLAVDGKPVKNQADLQELIAGLKPGAPVGMTIWRKGSKDSLTIKVGTQPEGFSTRGSLRIPKGDPHLKPNKTDEDESDESEFSSGRFGDLGFEAEAVNPSLVKKDRLKGEAVKAGVLITRVDPTSDAWECGLRVRQVIVQANDRPIENVGDLQEVLTKDALSKGVRIKYRVDNEDDYFVLRIR